MAAGRRSPMAARLGDAHDGALDAIAAPPAEPGEDPVAGCRQGQEDLGVAVPRDAVAAGADLVDDELDRDVGPLHRLCAWMRNSLLPSGPRSGLGVRPPTC